MKRRAIVAFVLCLPVLRVAHGAEGNPLAVLVQKLDGFVLKSTKMALSLTAAGRTLREEFSRFPDVARIKRTGATASADIRDLVEASRGIHTFLAENADALRNAGMGPKLSSLPSERNIRDLLRRAEALDALSDGLAVAEFAVYANEGWQRSDVLVKEGDIMRVDTTGKWKFHKSLPATTAKGFDNAGLERLARGAFGRSADRLESERYASSGNFGGLLARVRGMERVYVVGDKAIRAGADGPLEFRINDRKATDNSGVCTARTVVIGEEMLGALRTLEGGLAASVRELRTRSAMNLKKIGYGCHLWSSDHNEDFPPSFEAIYEKNYLRDRNVMEYPTRPGEVGYVYVTGLTAAAPAFCILVYEKEGRFADGRNVLYVGGNVMWMSEDEFQEALAKTRTYVQGKGRKRRRR